MTAVPAVRQFDAESVFRDELLDGERVLWAGQPDARRLFSQTDVFLVPFSLLWGGFAIYWETSVLTSDHPDGPPLFFVLWGIPFVLVGLYLIFGRFLHKARKKRRVYYAVTDRRVIALERARRGDRVLAAFLDTIPTVNKRLRRDGSGSITFGSSPWWTEWDSNTGMEMMGGGRGHWSGPVTFFDIQDAATVAGLVNDLRRRQPARP